MFKNMRYYNSSPTLKLSYCKSCFDKQKYIDQLEEEVTSLRWKLRYRQDKDKEPFFGSSTPSSKLPFKENSPEENKNNKGGAKIGHKGCGRKSIPEDEADEIIDRFVEEELCPDCGSSLEYKETLLRSIVDVCLNKAKNIVYRCQVKRCTNCNKQISNKPPVLPRNKYGNNLIANSVIMHYFHGIPLKRLENLWGKEVIEGNLIKTFHRLSNIWKPAIAKLKEGYRKSPVKHADETGWRTDGESGYSWLFCTDNISIFNFRDTRSSRVAKDVLGTKKLPGVLVVDRYGAYNKSPCKIQYCYAHLLRKLEDMGKEFPDKKEVQCFVSSLAPLLAEAMHLRSSPIPDSKYYKRSKKLKAEIRKIIRAPSEYPGVQNYQDIFRNNDHRLYHWVRDRNVPADNNRAERELRPTVIARKVSFGSQSEEGAKTRSVLMSIIHTASKRLKDKSLEEWFVWTLEQISKNPEVDPILLLP
ncbi:MAG: IS66 family transposase [Candidatus Omnitrophota bacterium]